MPRRLNTEGRSDATWPDAHARLTVTVTDADRLDIFAGDDDENPEAPYSVRREPALLLAWCERYAPEMLLDDEAAALRARNRIMSEITQKVRRANPKVAVTPSHVLEYLASRPSS